jgi:hypothetical protein
MSTGRLGLIVLVLGRGVAASEWPRNSRLTGLCRLFAEFVVPCLGVLIMSKVDIVETYHPVEGTKSPTNFGMDTFDPAVAPQLGVMQDMLFNIDYVKFLWNPLHVVAESGLLKDESKYCVRGVSITAERSCSRTVTLAQELQNIEANWTDLNSYPNSEAVISLSQQVYVLEYADNVEIRNLSLNCHIFQSGPAFYRICTENMNDSIQASLTACPDQLVNAGRCHHDESWLTSPGWTTSLKASFVNATVVYGRRFGIILSLDPHTTQIPVIISAADLLNVLKIFLETAPSSTQGLSSSILGQPTHMFGRLVAGHMVRLSKLVSKSPEIRVRAVNSLQSLMAMALYYSQPGMLSQAVLPVSGNTTAAQNKLAFGQTPPNSILAMAETRYHISVGYGTLIAYIVLGGVALTICFLTLFVGTISELLRHDAEPTLYPALDFYTQCKVQTDTGVVVSAKKRADLGWTVGQALFRDISGMRVVRRQRILGDRGDG